MKIKMTPNEARLNGLMNEMWETQHSWQYKLLDLLNYPELDSHVRLIRTQLNYLEATLSDRRKILESELRNRTNANAENEQNNK